jgi:hypothetical protein
MMVLVRLAFPRRTRRLSRQRPRCWFGRILNDTPLSFFRFAAVALSRLAGLLVLLHK